MAGPHIDGKGWVRVVEFKDIPDVTMNYSKEDVENQYMFWSKQHNINANREYNERMAPVLAEKRRKLIAAVAPHLNDAPKVVTGSIEQWESRQGNEHYSVMEVEEVLSELPEGCIVQVTIEVMGPVEENQ
jgi:NAD+--asparagine ADP-ribosyltransferase